MKRLVPMGKRVQRREGRISGREEDHRRTVLLHPAAITGGETSALAFALGGRAVVVVSDWSGGAEYSIAPDAKALGLKAGFRARNPETGEEIPVADGAARVTLGKYDYAIIVFE